MLFSTVALSLFSLASAAQHAGRSLTHGKRGKKESNFCKGKGGKKEDIFEEVEEDVSTKIGEIASDICLEHIPGTGRSINCDCSASETQGGGVGNVAAQSLIAGTPTADIALQNAGATRSDLRAGDFTIGDAYSFLPFSNDIVTMEATGGQIIDLLEEGLATTASGATGPYPYAYGLRYDVDLNSFTVSNVEVNPRVEGKWKEIDEAATYTVVTNGFLAAGNDGYVTANILEKEFTDKSDTQAFIDFVREVCLVKDLPLKIYSTKSITGGPQCSA